MGGRVLGRGFVAALAGLEITNIVVYTRLGSLYGVYGLALVAAAAIPAAYLQEITVLPGQSIFGYMRRRGPVYWVAASSIYLASMATLLVNIIGFSVLLSTAYNLSWLPLALIMAAAAWGVESSGHRVVLERVLTALSLGLGVYVAAFIVEAVYTGLPVSGRPPSYYDMLLLWGAAAAPYSLYMQGDERGEGFADIYAGLFSSILIGVSVAGLAALKTYPGGGEGLFSMVEPLRSLHPLSMLLFDAGLAASVVLASVSILAVSSTIMVGDTGIRGAGRGSHSLFNVVAASLFIVAAASAVYGGSVYVFFDNLVLYGTAAIGLLMTPILFSMTYIVYREGVGGWVNRVYLGAMACFSLYVSVLGVLEIL